MKRRHPSQQREAPFEHTYSGGHPAEQCFLMTHQMRRDRLGHIFLTAHICSRVEPKKKITTVYSKPEKISGMTHSSQGQSARYKGPRGLQAYYLPWGGPHPGSQGVNGGNCPGSHLLQGKQGTLKSRDAPFDTSSKHGIGCSCNLFKVRCRTEFPDCKSIQKSLGGTSSLLSILG